MPPPQDRVFFLTGINGAGKDTQAPLLADRITASGGLPARAIYAPKITPAAAGFRAAVLDGHPQSQFAELLGYMAQHAESAKEIARLRALTPQHMVINRGPETSLVYNGYGNFGPNDRELEIAGDIYRWLRRKYYTWSITILLDVDLATSRVRSSQQAETDYFQELGDEYFKRLIEGYYDLAQFADWRVVDASGSIEEVHELIWQEVEPLLKEAG